MKANEAADILREKLLQGETAFVFRKKDGSRRPAVGTTNAGLIPSDMMPQNADGTDPMERQRERGVVNYYDLEKGGWRSCRDENIIEVDGEEVEG